jgi:hypothetical protein
VVVGVCVGRGVGSANQLKATHAVKLFVYVYVRSKFPSIQITPQIDILSVLLPANSQYTRTGCGVPHS